MTSLDDLVAEGMLQPMVDVSHLTTYKLGGPARYFLEAKDERQLQEVGKALREEPILVLGKGSNLVISDHGFAGLVVHLGSGFSHMDVGDDGVVTAGGAAAMPAVARMCARAARSGLEFLVGIPGSVGGGVRMNAGCHGVEFRDRLRSARVVSLRSRSVTERTPDDLEMTYRYSNLNADEIVTEASLATKPGNAESIAHTMREIVRWRRDHQPGGTFNAGSVFKNPPGDSAGRIIDELGLKGTRIGGAMVSRKHANFFVAEPGVRAQDVYDLVLLIRHRVAAEADVLLEPEVKFAGRFGTDPGEETHDHES
jgi:UDP-N-acetylmuramate dehydrogenase